MVWKKSCREAAGSRVSCAGAAAGALTAGLMRYQEQMLNNLSQLSGEDCPEDCPPFPPHRCHF